MPTNFEANWWCVLVWFYLHTSTMEASDDSILHWENVAYHLLLRGKLNVKRSVEILTIVLVCK